MKTAIKILITILITAIVVVGIAYIFASIDTNLVKAKYDDIHNNITNSIHTSIKIKLSQTEKNQEDYQDALESVAKLNDVFLDIIILTMDGEVVTATNGKYNGTLISSLGVDIENAFLNPTGGVVPFILNNEEGYLAFNSYGDWDEERVAGVLPGDIFQSITAENSIYNFLEITLTIFSFILCFMFCMFFLKQLYDELYDARPSGDFLLKINQYGKILNKDKIFSEKFDIENLEDCLIDKDRSFPLQLKSDEPLFLSITDRLGQNQKLIFGCSKAKGNYKLVGGKATQYVDDYLKFSAMNRVDSVTNFLNFDQLKLEWEKVCEENIAEAMMVFLNIANYDYYNEIWGNKFAISLKIESTKLIEDVAREFGKLFTIEGGDTVLFITDKAKKDFFIENIDKIFEKFETTLKVEGQNLLVDVRAGVININMNDENTTLFSSLLNGANALSFAFRSDFRKYYILTAFFMGNKQYDIRTKEGILDLVYSGAVDVLYQPQMDIYTGKITGVEALCRIVGESESAISVQDFINTAERTGCMVELGEFIYNKAMENALKFKKLNVTVSINISPIQLMQIGFIENFLNTMKHKGLEGKDIHIEIIESVLVHSRHETAKKIDVFKRNGIKVEIDDFGTGYSSLAYLRDMKVDCVKLDSLFVRDIEKNQTDKIIVKNIIKLMKEMQVDTIIEGVSRTSQVEILKSLGCSVLQGFWLAQALPVEKAIELIKEVNKI